MELGISPREEIGNDLRARPLRLRGLEMKGRICLVALGGEADVIELNLIHAPAYGLLGERQVVVLHFAPGGIGPVAATAPVAAMSDGKTFENGRPFAAWLGLLPRQHSSAGKSPLFGIRKRGDPYLRTLLIHGARSVVYRAGRKTDHRSRWIADKQPRLGTTKACVALANKNARIVGSLIAHQEDYRRAV
jgi:hypothetical protein